MSAAFPWLLGVVALGVGYLVVGGNSGWLFAFWLFAFVAPAILVGLILTWPRSW